MVESVKPSRILSVAPIFNSDPASARQIMTAEEVAKHFQIHRSTIYKLIRRGQIPYFKIGSDYRFDRAIIETWMADRQVKV